VPIQGFVSSRARVVSASALLLLAGALVAVGALADRGDWDPALLAVLAVLVVGANLVEIEFKKISISGDFLGIVVAMALLGPAQAAVLGLLSSAVWLSRGPTRRPFALMALAEHATFPLIGALAMAWVGDALGVAPIDVGFAVAVVAGFAVANVINSALVFATHSALDGVSIRSCIRTVTVPLLPSEAAMVLLSSIIVYAEAHLGVVALAMLVALFFLYLFLLKELITSQHRAEELERRTEQLASLQVGVLTAMLRTLSMRDRMTARHSAAVARYTREIAKAAGCSEEEQDLAHTAGLLHDIGKFILPDHILLANTKLAEEDWQLIKMHPYQGSKVVREVEGYGPVADIIWAHHERIDGRGYPRGLAGEDIPVISRMISIADTYDVMTARDSYRDPVSSQTAIEELRRVSGAQLDGRLVEIFIQVLESKGVAFQHADDADFEAELAFERKVRDHAAPRVEELPAAA
jgi:putative nucleotidyltransferase with HDIG domain